MDKFTLDWTIQNFKNDKKNHGAIKSPGIDSGGGHWYVALAPIEETDTIASYLKFTKINAGGAREIKLQWTITIGSDPEHSISREGEMVTKFDSEHEGSTFQSDGSFDFVKKAKFWECIDDLVDDKGSLSVSAKVQVTYPNNEYQQMVSPSISRTNLTATDVVKVDKKHRRSNKRSKQVDTRTDDTTLTSKSAPVSMFPPVADKGDTVAVKNEEGGWWLAMLTQPLLDGIDITSKQIGVRWYDEVKVPVSRGKSKVTKYTLTSEKQMIAAAAIHPDPRPFKMISKGKGLFTLQEADAISRLQQKYGNA